MKYIDAEKLKEEIESISLIPQTSADYNDGRDDMKMMFLDIINSLQQSSKVEKNIAEKFARIVRGHLYELSAGFNMEFERTYLEITGEKMYQGYTD